MAAADRPPFEPSLRTLGPNLREPRVAVVIGDPIGHSLSPVIHNAAFVAAEMNWSYFAMSIPEGDANAALGAMRSLGLSGMSVTMPHKDAVASLVDRCTPEAARLDAVNCVYWRSGELVGDNTDGRGFVDALAHDEGFDLAGKRVAVLGAGGAARAVIAAANDAGAADIAIINRTVERAEAALPLAGSVGRLAQADALSEVDLVVNATSVGMNNRDLPVDPDLLRSGQLVVDLIYEPAYTPLLLEARERGAIAVNGLGMLIHQAAYAFELWTGERPDLDAMSAAATSELIARRS